MPIPEPPFTIGIEEEYLLVDRGSRDLCNDPPSEIMKRCQELAPGQVTPEFLRSQIEVGTLPSKNIAAARRNLTELRKTIIQVAEDYDLAPIAASTHPFASWHEQKLTRKERYQVLARDMQVMARRLLICGMHVHIGIDDDELRIDLMKQFSYFLPHLLALSTSSPFWEGENTGLHSFRLTVFDGVQRTGIPERFASYGEYERHVAVLTRAGLIEDATKIWWDLRPSARFPTLEIRIADVCTDIEDALCIAALSVCIMRMLFRLRRGNQRWRTYARMLLNENRWRAMRYGLNNGLTDFGRGEVVPFVELQEELFDLVREDAESLDCLPEVERMRYITTHGTSAHRQLQCYGQEIQNGRTQSEALISVVDMLIEQTRKGIF